MFSTVSRVSQASTRARKVSRFSEDRTDDFAAIYVDLEASDDEPIVTIDISHRDETSIVRVVDLLNADIEFLASYPKKPYNKLSTYQRRLQTYSFSIVLVKDAPLDIATEIFTRINVTGRPLSVFEIMVAKTFDAKRNFDLADEYDKLIEQLRNASYDTIPSATVLQTLAAILVKECSKKAILKLHKSDVIETWPRAVEAIYSSVDYFRSYYRIPVSRLLPYAALLVPFGYFFFNHPDKPTGDLQKYLQDFFWRSSLGGRYSVSLESRLAQDIRKIDQMLEGTLPTYEVPIDVSPNFIEDNGWFGTGRSFVKRYSAFWLTNSRDLLWTML